MRNAFILALISLAALLPLQVVRAQDITFSGAEIVNLARTIVVQTATTPELPSAYQMTMSNGHAMVITAPNAFELLCRSIIAWRQTNGFPREISIQLDDLKGPDPGPATRYETKSPGEMMAMASNEIGLYAGVWMQLASAPGHQLAPAVSTETYRGVTPAQFIVAMAALIDETMKKNEFPTTIAMPKVRSPQDWLNTDQPVKVSDTSAPTTPQNPQSPSDPPKPAAEIDLRIVLNDIELSESGPVLPNGRGPIPPFCGIVHIGVVGYGPVGELHLRLDSKKLTTFIGAGSHAYDLNTLPMSDGLHTISATATNTDGKTYAYVFSFTVHNGRRSGFTPAEITDVNVK